MLVHVRFSCSLYSACVALYRAACRGYTVPRHPAKCQALYRAIYFLHKTCTVLLCNLALYRAAAGMILYIYKIKAGVKLWLYLQKND
mgnify:CR=1 FL=1